MAPLPDGSVALLRAGSIKYMSKNILCVIKASLPTANRLTCLVVIDSDNHRISGI